MRKNAIKVRMGEAERVTWKIGVQTRYQEHLPCCRWKRGCDCGDCCDCCCDCCDCCGDCCSTASTSPSMESTVKLLMLMPGGRLLTPLFSSRCDGVGWCEMGSSSMNVAFAV